MFIRSAIFLTSVEPTEPVSSPVCAADAFSECADPADGLRDGDLTVSKLVDVLRLLPPIGVLLLPADKPPAVADNDDDDDAGATGWLQLLGTLTAQRL